jgi:hypothetical protein
MPVVVVYVLIVERGYVAVAVPLMEVVKVGIPVLMDSV